MYRDVRRFGGNAVDMADRSGMNKTDWLRLTLRLLY